MSNKFLTLYRLTAKIDSQGEGLANKPEPVRLILPEPLPKSARVVGLVPVIHPQTYASLVHGGQEPLDEPLVDVVFEADAIEVHDNAKGMNWRADPEE